VIEPIIKIKLKAVSDNSNNGDIRDTIKMPAVTIVAAWINAEIGVGPSIESGNQTCNGTCADLPIAPMNKQIQITVINDQALSPKSVIVVSAWVSTLAKTVA
jgi:hypothetical protein